MDERSQRVVHLQAEITTLVQHLTSSSCGHHHQGGGDDDALPGQAGKRGLLLHRTKMGGREGPVCAPSMVIQEKLQTLFALQDEILALERKRAQERLSSAQAEMEQLRTRLHQLTVLVPFPS